MRTALIGDSLTTHLLGYNWHPIFWGNDIQGPNALGWWRVVVLPGVPKRDVEGLMTGDDADPENPDKPRRIRIHSLDLAAARRARNGAQLVAASRMRPAVQIPAGTPRRVIG